MTPVAENLEDARHSRRRGFGWERGSGVSRLLARAGSASAKGLDLWADRGSGAAFDLEPDSGVLELASNDDLAAAPGGQPARSRRTAGRSAACLDYAVPDDFTEVANWLQERTADRA